MERWYWSGNLVSLTLNVEVITPELEITITFSNHCFGTPLNLTIDLYTHTDCTNICPVNIPNT